VPHGLAVVTGSSRGIGRAIALALASTGHDVAVAYRNRADAAHGVVAEIEERGRRAVAYRLDVSNFGQARAVLDAAESDLGPLRVLVNNAGVLSQKPYDTLTEDDWRATLAVNLEGAFFCAKEAIPRIRAAGGGRIVNIASSGGQLGGTLAMHYAASKAGIIGLTKSLARVGAPDVLVNCVSPGLIETEMTADEIASEAGAAKIASIPLGRVGSAEEVANAVAFLVSADAAYITGQTLNVNGGLYMG